MSQTVDKVVLNPDGNLIVYEGEVRVEKGCPDCTRGDKKVRCGSWCPFLEINKRNQSGEDQWEIIFRCRPLPPSMSGFMYLHTGLFTDLRLTPKQQMELTCQMIEHDMQLRQRRRARLDHMKAAADEPDKPTLKEIKECDRKHPVDD